MAKGIRNKPSSFKSFRYRRQWPNITRREAEGIARALAKLNRIWFGYDLRLLALYDAYNNEIAKEVENLLGKHILVQEVGDGWYAVYEVIMNVRKE